METETQTFERLEDSQGLETLDAKLAAALNDIIVGDLAVKINTTKENMGRQGILLRGRQMLHMIYKNYELTDGSNGLIQLQDLINVTLVNDNVTA